MFPKPVTSLLGPWISGAAQVAEQLVLADVRQRSGARGHSSAHSARPTPEPTDHGHGRVPVEEGTSAEASFEEYSGQSERGSEAFAVTFHDRPDSRSCQVVPQAEGAEALAPERAFLSSRKAAQCSQRLRGILDAIQILEYRH